MNEEKGFNKTVINWYPGHMATITQTIIKWGFLRNEILQVLIKKEEKFEKTG